MVSRTTFSQAQLPCNNTTVPADELPNRHLLNLVNLRLVNEVTWNLKQMSLSSKGVAGASRIKRACHLRRLTVSVLRGLDRRIRGARPWLDRPPVLEPSRKGEEVAVKLSHEGLDDPLAGAEVRVASLVDRAEGLPSNRLNQ